MSYNTGNPIGSTDARDLLDNAENFDRALNSTAPTWTDRFGVTRTTVPKAFADIAADVTAVDSSRIAAQAEIAADVAAVEAAKNTAIDDIAGKVAEVDPVVAATYVGQAEAARDAAALSATAAANSATQAADAVDGLRDELAAPGGSALVEYDGGSLLQALNSAKALVSIAQLRAYSGTATAIRISETGFVAVFRNRGVVSGWPDNGITVFKDALNRNWERVYEGPVYPEWAGAVGNGITDDSVAFQTWLSWGGALALGFKKNYLLRNVSPMAFAGNTNIQGNGSTIIIDRLATVTNGAMTVNGAGMQGIELLITQSIPKHTYEVFVSSAAGFAPGDLVRIVSNEYFNGATHGDGTSFNGYGLKTKGELSSIREVNYETNVITLAEKTKDSYTVGGGLTPTIRKRLVTRNVFFENVNFRCLTGNGGSHSTDNSTFPTGSRALTATDVEDLSFINCTFSNFPRSALDLNRCRDVTFNGCTYNGYDMADLTNTATISQWFTGVLSYGCENVTFVGNTARNSRRHFNADSTPGDVIARNIVISGNTSVNCIHTAGTHACENVVISANVGISSGGINFRGKDVVICDNVISLSTPSSFAISCGHNEAQTVGYTQQSSVGNVAIVNNTINGQCLNGVVVAANVESLTISQNRLQTISQSAVYVIGKRTENVIIADNFIRTTSTQTPDAASHHTIWLPNFSTIPREVLNNISIRGNQLVGRNFGGIKISGSAVTSPADNIMITNNSLKQVNDKFAIGYTGTWSNPLDVTGSFGANRMESGNFYPDALPELGNVYGPV